MVPDIPSHGYISESTLPKCQWSTKCGGQQWTRNETLWYFCIMWPVKLCWVFDLLCIGSHAKHCKLVTSLIEVFSSHLLELCQLFLRLERKLFKWADQTCVVDSNKPCWTWLDFLNSDAANSQPTFLIDKLIWRVRSVVVMVLRLWSTFHWSHRAFWSSRMSLKLLYIAIATRYCTLPLYNCLNGRG